MIVFDGTKRTYCMIRNKSKIGGEGYFRIVKVGEARLKLFATWFLHLGLNYFLILLNFYLKKLESMNTS